MTIIHSVRAFADTIPYSVSLTDDLGHEWLADEPLDEGGGNVGPTPKLLLFSSMGACTAITLQMYAARKKWPLKSIEIELQLNPEGDPATGNDIVRKIKSWEGRKARMPAMSVLFGPYGPPTIS